MCRLDVKLLNEVMLILFCPVPSLDKILTKPNEVFVLRSIWHQMNDVAVFLLSVIRFQFKILWHIHNKLKIRRAVKTTTHANFGISL
jgi:hypothetical protein